jgi:ribonuclease J
MLDDIKLLHSKNMLDNACIIYSMWDGYIEQQDSLRDFLEELKKMNIKIEKLHTSGHADVHAMRLVNELLNPKQTIIIHTEDNSNGKDIFNNVITADDNEIIVVN